MKMKTGSLSSRIQKMSWSELTKTFNALGWQLETDKPNIKRYRRGLQKISLVNVGKKKWKIEYFLGRRLADSAGVTDEEFAKVVAIELGVLRNFRPNPDF